jgi:hypothetical protein
MHAPAMHKIMDAATAPPNVHPRNFKDVENVFISPHKLTIQTRRHWQPRQYAGRLELQIVFILILQTGRACGAAGSNLSDVPLYAAIRTNQIGVVFPEHFPEMHPALPALRTWSRGLNGGFEPVLDTIVDDDGTDEYRYRQNNGACGAYPSSH